MKVDRLHPALAAARLAFMALLCTLLALPFYWMVQISLAGGVGGGWWPDRATLSAYAELIHRFPVGRYYLNTVAVAVAAATLQVGLALPMAYAFARLGVPGARIVFLLVISTMLVPDEVKLIPNYLLAADLGWIDTYAGLIVPVAAHAFPVFVLHEHFRRLPRETFEAAELDGAHPLRQVWSVALPQSLPLLFALWMVALIGRWNDYLWPLVIVDSESMRTLSVGLAYLKDSESAQMEWGGLMAAAVVSGLPLAIFFAIFHRKFMQTMPR